MPQGSESTLLTVDRLPLFRHARSTADVETRIWQHRTMGTQFNCRASAMMALRAYASLTRRSSCALTATTTVLADINTAPTAGDSRMPCDASTPAESGIATML